MTDDFVIRWDVESPPDEKNFKIETPEYHNDVISWDVSKKPDPKELEEETKKLERKAEKKVAKSFSEYLAEKTDEEDEWDRYYREAKEEVEREDRRYAYEQDFWERLANREHEDDRYIHRYGRDECGWNSYPGAWRRLLDSRR